MLAQKKKFKARDDLQTEEQVTNISWHIALNNNYNDWIKDLLRNHWKTYAWP